MPRRTDHTSSFMIVLACLGACVPDWPLPGLGDCPGEDCTGTTGPGAPTTEVSSPTEPLATTDGPATGGDGDTTGDGTSSSPDSEDGGTADASEPPALGPYAVTPGYTNVNALLEVTATAYNSQGVRMQIDGGEPVELEEVAPGEFAGTIPAFTAFDNDKHVARLTPWANIEGEAEEVEYVIALPPPGFERYWSVGGSAGFVAAVGVLPDGRPVEFGTFYEMDEPRCYLHLRRPDGSSVEWLPVLPSTYCRATDMTIDPVTGWMHVLVDRQSGDGVIWWVGEIAAWGLGPQSVGVGELGDTALALARHNGMLAVCGETKVETDDGCDALAVLLHPGEQAERRSFDYFPEGKPGMQHKFGETARDCKFSGNTLVLVGEAHGRHDYPATDERDRFGLFEVDVVADDAGKWTVAGPGSGVQSGGLALDVDDLGRYHIAVYTCADDCDPDGEVRVYQPGGVLDAQVQLGHLGSLWLGPHDIAWSPADYAVVALGEQVGQEFVFKAVAVDPDEPEPLWVFTPKDTQGPQLGLVAATGPWGEVYLGGIGKGNGPAFCVVGG